MPTRHPLSNLKTRAQAAFRFHFYLDPFEAAADDNETAARDCSVVCVCNVKTPADVWAPCRCAHCLGAAQ